MEHANKYIKKYILTYIHTHIHTYTYIHTYIHKYIYTYIHTYTHTHIIYTYTYIHTYTHIHTYAYIHTLLHTYTHTYVHTHIQEKNPIQILTDGRMSESGVVSGLAIYRSGESINRIQCRLNKKCTNNQAEHSAILTALEHVEKIET